MRGKAVFHILNVSLMLLLVSSAITAPPLSAERASNPPERPALLASSPAWPEESDDTPAGLRVLASDARGVTLELVTPEYTVIRGEDDSGLCARLVVDGYSGAGVSGTPELPVKGAVVGIPVQGEVTLTVADVETIAVPEPYTICPVGRPIVEMSLSDEPPRYEGEVRVRDATAYTTAGFVPAEPAALLSTGFVRSQRVAQVQFRPFQYNPVTGELRFARRIRVQLTFDAASQTTGERLAQALSTPAEMDEGVFEDVLQHTLANYEAARPWRDAPQHLPATAMVQSPVSGGAHGDGAYKILVDADGIYHLTYTALLAAGVPVDSLDPRTLHLHNQGNQVAIHVAGEADGVFDAGDYVLFYGQKMTTRYTDVNVYWLTWGGANGLRMATSDGTPGGAPVPAYYRTTQRIERNRTYQSSRPSGPDDDRWYWQWVWAETPTTFKTDFTLTYPLTTPTSATFGGLFKGYDAQTQHHTRVYLNGVLLDDARWLPTAAYTFTATVPQSALISGTNTISVSVPISRSYFLINWFEMTYNRHYAATGDTLAFSGDAAGTWEYRVDAFTTDAIEVFDVSAPGAPIRILGADVIPTGGAHRLAFQQTISAKRAYLALTTAQRRSPKAIAADVPADLLSTTNGADYIMIAHPDFITAIQPLADYHTGQGLRVQVVDVAEVYDTFNYGIFDPEAIRNFLKYAYTSWARPAPTYVLLVGDGHFDFKNYFGRGETIYIPPYLADIDPWMGETAADNRYVTVSGDDILPDMHLGRFPVKTVAETTAMVNKALGYMQNPPTTEWNRDILFLADNSDDAGDFYAYSDVVADHYVPPLYNAHKIYYMQTHSTVSTMRAAMLDAINQGQLIVNYVGHGAVTYWAWSESERLTILRIADIGALNNTGKLPFFVPMTCLEGYYIYPSGSTNFSAISEMFVRAPERASLASWSPTGLGLASGHDIMNRVLFQAIFYDHVIELGPATTLGKLAMAGQGHDELIDTYILFGDPALALNVLKADLHITKTAQTMPPTALFPETITYTLAYTNAGPSTAYGVVITDVLPAGLENLVVVSSGMTITQRAGTAYVWDVADLPAGTGGVITITTTVAPTFRGVLDNHAEIVSDVLDRHKDNNTAAVQTPVGIGPVVTISKSGNNAILTWDAVVGATQYRVYRSPEAYFVPSPSHVISTVTALNHTDPGKIGDPDVNYFYVVTAVDAQERESQPSNAVGQFDFALLPGEPGSTRYNAIALPLDVIAQLPNAGALAGYIGDSVQQVLHWDPVAQSYEAWLPPFSVGTNFPLRVGHVYWIQVNSDAPSVLSFVGGVPPQNTVRFDLVGDDQACLFNEFSLPLDQTGITSATALAEALGTANVEQALRWRADVHVFEFWLPEIDFGVDFTTRAGHPYHVCLTSGAPVAKRVLAEEGGAAGPDAFVRITQPEVNFNAAYLSVAASTGAGTPTDVTYVHWDLSDIPPDAFIHIAALTLTANYATGTDGVMLGLYAAESGWQEETLTWATAPALGALIETRSAPTASGQAVTFNSAALRDYLNDKIRSGADHASFALRFTEGCRLFALARFDDRESGRAGPAMHLEYVIYMPDLVIQKTGPAVAHPGDMITYTLTYANSGDAIAPYINIVDVLPPEMTVDRAAGAIMPPQADRELRWEVFDLAPGDGGVLTFTALISPTFSGMLTNTATITTTAVESNTTNNASLPIVTVVRAPDLTIHKSGPATAYPGDTITYTLVYTNAGDAPAPYVTITDVLPSQLTPFDHTGTIMLPLPGQTLTWEVFDLAPGDGGVLTFTAIVNPTFAGLLTNTATIATPIFDSDITNNTSPPAVTEIRAPDLIIHKTGPATAYPGEMIEYTLVYTNAGNAPAPYVTITDVLPPHLTVFDHSGTILPLPGQTLTWEVFDLAPGDGGMLTITAIVSSAFTGLLTNTATIATPVFDSDLSNNVSPPVVTAVGMPDLAIHKTGPATAYPGDVIEYTLVYTNVGSAPAPNVTITDLLPLNTQLYDHSGTILLPLPGHTLTWEVFDLAPGAGGTLTVSVIIDPAFSGWLTNTATIATTAPEATLDNNASAAWTQVVSRPVTSHYIYLPLITRDSP